MEKTIKNVALGYPGRRLMKGKDMTKREPCLTTSRAYPPSVHARSIEVGSRSEDLEARTDAVAAIATENVTSVDRDARFPEEAITAARAQRLLGIMVPPSLGGEGASFFDVVDVCYELGRACSSTARRATASQRSLAD